jgi:hypothetical protein
MGVDGEPDSPADRRHHPDLAQPDKDMTMAHSILDLISERQAAVAATITDLREHIGKLTNELRTAEIEFNDLATTRTTLNRLTATSDDLTASNPLEITAYQQILAVFHTGNGALRAKDVCHALGMGVEPKDTEGVRAKLKRLVKRRQLTEAEPGLFALPVPPAAADQATTSNSNQDET